MTIHNLLRVIHVFSYAYAKKAIGVLFIAKCMIRYAERCKGVYNSPKHFTTT